MKQNLRWALAGLSLSMLLASLGTSIANVALPTLAMTFDAPYREVQWVVLAYLLANTLLIVSVGRLGDAIGRRRLLLAGIVLFGVASIMSAVAPSLAALIAARAVQGLGAATMMALTMAFVAETVPKEQTGRAMGLLATMSAIGTAVGPTLGGLLIAGLGWRSIFLVNVPLSLVAFALAYRHLPMPRAAVTNAPSPRLSLTILRDSRLTASLAMSTLVSTVMMATLVVGPFYLSHGLGLQAVTVGLVMSVGPVVAALTGVPAGRLADHFGAPRTTRAGLLLMAMGSFALAMMPAAFGVPGYIAPVVLITAGYALFQTSNNTVVMTDVAASRASQTGVVSGMLNLSRNLGLIAGASVMGAVFVATGLRDTFAVAGALVAIALTIAVRSANVKGLRWKFTS